MLPSTRPRPRTRRTPRTLPRQAQGHTPRPPPPAWKKTKRRQTARLRLPAPRQPSSGQRTPPH
eukprot:6031190-Lingulodinium_polyedra.AAC.1